MSKISIKQTAQYIEYYKGGILHRDDGPAIEYFDGGYTYYKHGKIHRTDGPAATTSNGCFFWWYDNVWTKAQFPDGFIEYKGTTEQEYLRKNG